jgi:hypothetical protein
MIVSDKALEAQAEKAVDYKGRTALGILTKEDFALIVVPPWQDREILQAVLNALEKKGIRADVLWEHDLLHVPYEDLVHTTAAEGWKELLYFQPSMAEFLTSRGIEEMPPGRICRTEDLSRPLGDYMRANPKYTAVFMQTGGGGHIQNGMGDQRNKFKGQWEHITRERFLSNFVLYPSEIVSMLDRKVLEMGARVAEIRCTDPCGTYFTCPVDEEEASIWAESQKIAPTSHMLGLPLMGVRLMTMRYLLKPAMIKVPKSNGVIAGTCGHYGYYPHIKAYIRDGWIERIEGGGKMGELLNEIMARTRDIQFPDFPKPGWLYVNGAAIGTNPKGFRNKDMFDSLERLPNSFDRLRSGVIHWDMGGESYSDEFVNFCKEHKLPRKHAWHIHTYLNTFEVRFRGSTEWQKIIDNGHLTALDDPEIIALAARYGDPGELLKEDWNPIIPGVNYPGDYMRDFGNDPAAWVWKEVNGLLPQTIGCNMK